MITKEEIIDEIYNALKDQEIPEVNFLDELMGRLPRHWLKTELRCLVKNQELIRMHQKEKRHPETAQHPWRLFGKFRRAI